MTQQSDHPASAGDGHAVDSRLARPDAITYVHIPASDVHQAAEFYRDCFGWTINDLESERPSFDDASGNVSGAWITDHSAATEPGLLPYIYVAEIEATVARISAHGGAMITHPYPEGKLTVATFRDPAGNVLGVWHDTTRRQPTPALRQSGSRAQVAPVPEHLHTVTPRLLIPDASAAIDFYIKAFDASEVAERHCTRTGSSFTPSCGSATRS